MTQQFLWKRVIKGKVKTHYGPKGPNGRSLTRCLLHEVTRGIATAPSMKQPGVSLLPPGWDASVILLGNTSS